VEWSCILSAVLYDDFEQSVEIRADVCVELLRSDVSAVLPDEPFGEFGEPRNVDEGDGGLKLLTFSCQMQTFRVQCKTLPHAKRNVSRKNGIEKRMSRRIDGAVDLLQHSDRYGRR
jgi:hypothetical protein